MYIHLAYVCLKTSIELILLLHFLNQESSTSDDNFQLYDQLSSSYPSLLPPLIYERDTVSV